MNTAVFFPGFNQRVEDLEHEPFRLLASLGELGNLVHFYRGTLHRGLNRYGMRHVPIGSNPAKSGYILDYALKSFRFLKEHRIDLIYCFDVDMAFLLHWAARLYRIPLILQVGVDWNAYNRLTGQRWKRLVKDMAKRTVLRYAAEVIVLAHHLKVPVESYGRSPRVLYPFVDLDDYPSCLAGENGQVRRLLFIGRLTPVKGVRYLIDSLPLVRKQNERFHLTVVGGSPVGRRSDESYVRERVREYALWEYVTLVGQVPHSQVPAYLRNADFVVMPSETEGFHYALLEAWASGVPVLATDIPFYRELIDSSVGRLCGFSPESMAEGILSLLAMDNETLAGMKAAARKKAETLTETSMNSWGRFAHACAREVRGRWASAASHQKEVPHGSRGIR